MNTDCCYRIALVGEGGTGKTSIALRFARQEFHIVSTYDPTIEDSYRKQVDIDQIPCTIEIADTAGQEEYSALLETTMRDAHGFILVFSVDSEKSFSEITTYYQQIKHAKPASPVVLVGNKEDMTQGREVARDSASGLAEKLHCPYFWTSAKTGCNINKVFETVVRMLRLRETGPTNLPLEPRKKEKTCVIC